jgi:hypothetical protein
LVESDVQNINISSNTLALEVAETTNFTKTFIDSTETFHSGNTVLDEFSKK